MDLIALLPPLEQEFLGKDSAGAYKMTYGANAISHLMRLFAHDTPTPQDIEAFLSHINLKYAPQTRHDLTQRLGVFLPELLETFFASPTWATDTNENPETTTLNTFLGYWTMVSHLSIFENFMPESVSQRDILMRLLKKTKPYHLDLSYQNLDQTNLSYFEADNPNFAYASLKRASLLYARMPKAVFDNANLQYVQASNAYLPESYWSGTNLANAQFLGAELSKGVWHKANMLYADFSQASLAESYLDYSNLQAVDFTMANLQKCHIFSSDFRFANLAKADLAYSKINTVDMRDTNLYRTNFQYAEISDTVLQAKTFEKADFRHAVLGERNQESLEKQGAIVK